MAVHHRFRAPTGHGEVLTVPGFDAIPALVEENRKRLDRTDVMLGGLPLRELRAIARREVLALATEGSRQQAQGPGGRAHVGQAVPLAHTASASPDTPLLLVGHQPELSHPGVWVKNFALNGIARKVGGIPLNLVVDNDTLKSTSLRVPVLGNRDPGSVHLAAVSFDRFEGEVPYEDRAILDGEHFRTLAARTAPLWANWGYEPVLNRCWDWANRACAASEPTQTPTGHHLGSEGLHHPLAWNLGDLLTELRRHHESAWGCENLEVKVSGLSRLGSFHRFASHILTDLPRFRAVYNAAVHGYRIAHGLRSATHPVPDLALGEAPFWVRKADGRRQRATEHSTGDELRPRALTLTLFARICLGDVFLHGIGGGKYDEVTDVIIRDYFGIEPPAYQVLSATLHLPLAGFPATRADVQRAERLVRDLTWNPQRLIPADLSSARVLRLISDHTTLTANEPPYADHAARKAWFRELQRLNAALRPFVENQVRPAQASLARMRAEVQANAVLRRRDYAWVLHPEATLRGFLQRFLDV